ncbi:MAG: glycosyltransferase family 2 protein [Ectothiorhodospiraceae bacterium]|nr:glycosyltransferase family 2 protein [Ectothiorhodospiraceae bacterium]
MQDLLVSVVIATHNRARLLEQAVRSVIDQTYRPLEIVVVDDGSTDETPQRMKLLETRESHGDGISLHYIRQTNSGPARARNRGVEACRGTYVLFMDDDDLMAKDAIAHLVAALEGRTDAAISFGGHAYTDADGKPEPTVHLPPGIRSPDTLLAEMIRGTWFVPIHGNVFTRRALERIGPWNAQLTSQEDDEFILRAMLAGVAFVPAPGALVYYRQHIGVRRSQPGAPGHWNETGQTRRLHADLAIREMAFRALQEDDDPERFRVAFAGWYQRLLKRYRPILEKVDLSGNTLIQWVRTGFDVAPSAHQATGKAGAVPHPLNRVQDGGS